MRAHQAQGRLGARFPNTKLLASVLTPRRQNLPPARQRPKPGQLDWSACGALRAQNTSQTQSGWIPLLRATRHEPKRLEQPLRVPRTKLLDWLINGLIACQGPHPQNRKSVTQEGRKVKPILPTTPSRCTDRTTAEIT